MTINELFTTETVGLVQVLPTSVVRVHDGDRFELQITLVRKNLSGGDLRMLAYNGSTPGPTLHVDQRSEITVQVCNERGDVEATVHWHGLRLENRFDDLPHETQAPIPVGGTFTYKVQFPDAGYYWYHPHSAKTSPRRWVCTARSSSSPLTQPIGRRLPVAGCRRTCSDVQRITQRRPRHSVANAAWHARRVGSARLQR